MLGLTELVIVEGFPELKSAFRIISQVLLRRRAYLGLPPSSPVPLLTCCDDVTRSMVEHHPREYRVVIHHETVGMILDPVQITLIILLELQGFARVVAAF